MKSFFINLVAVFGFLVMAGAPYSVSAAAPAASSSVRETLTYDVYYHWGIIWKKAGKGVLTLNAEKTADGDSRLHGRLAARSLSIVESIMKVRDTLDAYMTHSYLPIEYCKKTNEGSYRAVERNYYSFDLKDRSKDISVANIDSTLVNVRRWRNKKGNDQVHLAADALGYDMLSIFYIIRRLDFNNMQKGTQFKYPIFSGVKMVWMDVEYCGSEICEMKNGSKHNSHRLELSFKSKDSDHTPLQVWLSADSSHKPLKVIIQLKRIGAVQGELVM